MRAGKHVTVVMPAWNEAPALAGLLPAMPGWVDRVVIGDNASTDATRAVATARGAVVVDVPRRGYGAACEAAARAALSLGTDVLAFMDSDGSCDPAETARVVDPVIRGDTDLAIGRRGRPRAMGAHQRFGNDLVCALMRWGFDSEVTDLGPFRACRTATYARLDLRDRAYGWTAEMQARALRFGLRVDEVPVTWTPGRAPSKISGTVRGTVRAGLGLVGRTSLEIVAARRERVVTRRARRRPTERAA